MNNQNLSSAKKELLLKEYNTTLTNEIEYYKHKIIDSLYPTEELPDGISYDDLNVIVSKSTSVRKRDNNLEAVLGKSPTFLDDIDDNLLIEDDIVKQFRKNRMNKDGSLESSSSEWDYVTTVFDENKNNTGYVRTKDESTNDDDDDGFYFA